MTDCDVDADVDVRDPDEKSIMTYVAQFLQYSRDLPVPEEEMQVCIIFCANIEQLIAPFHTAVNVCRKVFMSFKLLTPTLTTSSGGVSDFAQNNQNEG